MTEVPQVARQSREALAGRMQSCGKVVSSVGQATPKSVELLLSGGTDEAITVAVMRPGQYLDPGRRVLIATSTDRGRTWSETRQIDIANPNAAVAGTRTSQGFIFVYNDHVGKRDQLSLGFATRADAAWQEIYLLEDEVDTRKHEFRFSYPWLVRQDGEYHVFYTWNRERIKHVVFNEAWLNQKIEATRG